MGAMLTARERYTALREYIFEANHRLPCAVDRVIPIPSGLHADCRQDAAVGLLRAIERFDYEGDVQFSTFAMFHMQRSAQLGFEHVREGMKVPYPAIGTLYAMRRELSLSPRSFDAAGAAQGFDVPLPTAQSLLALASKPGLASRLIGDPRGERVDDRCLRDEQRDKVQQALESLPPTLRRAIELTFGFNGDPISEREAAGHLGVCRQWVNQLIGKALGLLKERLDPELG